MKITAKMSMIGSAVFAVVCFAVAINGFISLGDVQDPVARSDGYGFAWFWTFLGSIGVLFGGLSYWLIRTHKEDD